MECPHFNGDFLSLNCDGSPKTRNVLKGSIISRYSFKKPEDDTGKYFSYEAVSYPERALPEKGTLYRYSEQRGQYPFRFLCYIRPSSTLEEIIVRLYLLRMKITLLIVAGYEKRVSCMIVISTPMP